MHASLRAAAGAVLIALVALLAPGVATAATNQFPPDTTVPGFPTETTLAPGVAPPTTGVLVPDPSATTLPGAATTVADDSVTEVDSGDDGATDPDATRTVWLVIAGLGGVAFLILVLTVVYARHTRPDRWHGGHDDWDLPESQEEAFAPTAARSVFDHKDDEQGFWWAED